jgi:hypothetical protein
MFSKIRENLKYLNESKEEFPKVSLREELCVLSEKFLSFEEKLKVGTMTDEDFDQMEKIAEQIFEMTNAVILEIQQQQATKSLNGLNKIFSIKDLVSKK